MLTTCLLQIIADIAATHYSNDKTPSNNPSLSNSNNNTPSESATLTSRSSVSTDFNTVPTANNDNDKLSPPSQNVTAPVDSTVCESSTSSTTPVCSRPTYDINKVTVDPDCTECSTTRHHPSPGQLVMYLHALSYQVTNCLSRWCCLNVMFL